MGLSSSIISNPVDNAIVSNIGSTVQSNCVVMYSKAMCPYCVMARKALQQIGAEFLEIDINKEPNTSEIQDALASLTGARSVPRVFIGGKCIGGGSETKALAANGQLQTMIQKCQG